jgi:hypothetical protein
MAEDIRDRVKPWEIDTSEHFWGMFDKVEVESCYRFLLYNNQVNEDWTFTTEKPHIYTDKSHTPYVEQTEKGLRFTELAVSILSRKLKKGE